MHYLLKNKQQRFNDGSIVKETSCGIVDTQVSRMNKAAALMEHEGWDLQELVTRLRRLSEETVLRDFNLFHSIVTLPKPTYLQGLTLAAKRFLAHRVTELSLQTSTEAQRVMPCAIEALSAPIRLRNFPSPTIPEYVGRNKPMRFSRRLVYRRIV